MKTQKQLKEEEFKPIIEVKDYLYKGDVIYGTRYYDDVDSWILEDGDIYYTEELKEEYEVSFLTCKELYEKSLLAQKIEDKKAFMEIIEKLSLKQLKVPKITISEGTGFIFTEELKQAVEKI